MRLPIALLLIGLPLLAQEAAKPAEQAKPEEKKEQPAAAKPEEKPAESPVPAGEPSVSGTLDFGYRWRSDVAGDVNAYRSVVDLGSGPKLFGLDFTVQDPKKRLFDRLDVHGYGWGGDPYSTAHLDARKIGIYNLTVDYRNIAYFDFLPSFANATGSLDEQSFDTHRRLADVQLDLRPGKRIIPYLAYNHDSGSGRGIATLVSGAVNEYPVATNLADNTNNYRGGVRLEMRKFHVTLEQGGTTFKDDQGLSNSLLNPGDRTTAFLGQQLFLAGLSENYHIRGDSIYSKVLVTGNPVSWADLYGQFLYSRPETDSRLAQSADGLLGLQNPLLVFNMQTDQFLGSAKMPHTSGNLGAEIRPFRRLRIIESWTTDRLHNAAFGLLTDQLVLPSGAPTQTLNIAAAQRLEMNWNRQELNALFDVTSKLTIRAGHRYIWGDSTVPQAPPTAFEGAVQLRQQVALGGVSYRPVSKMWVNFDVEGASSDHTYFRTSLHDYVRTRGRVRYQVLSALSLNYAASSLSNSNPSPGIDYSFDSQAHSLSAIWTPGGGKRVSVLGDYTISRLRSDITYLEPEDLSRQRSLYVDNAHTASAVVDLKFPSYAGMTPTMSFGGSLFRSSGSRPSRFYQPLVRLAVPLQKHVYWTTEWRWYGFGEQFYLFEGFRSHLLMTGLRLTR